MDEVFSRLRNLRDTSYSFFPKESYCVILSLFAARVAVFFESNQSGVNWTKKGRVKVYLPSCRTNREVNQNGELSINKQPL